MSRSLMTDHFVCPRSVKAKHADQQAYENLLGLSRRGRRSDKTRVFHYLVEAAPSRRKNHLTKHQAPSATRTSCRRQRSDKRSGRTSDLGSLNPRHEKAPTKLMIGAVSYLKLGDDLLSHKETLHYHWR